MGQAEDSRGQRVGEGLLIGLATAVVAAAVMQSQPLQSANDRSRWATVWSLVERRTYQIDEIDRIPHWTTIDKVRHRVSEDAEWHVYSSKPPLLSTLVAGLYALERVTLGYGLFAETTFVTRLLLLFVNVIPFAVSLAVLRNALQRVPTSPAARLFVLATAGFGSMLNPYLSTLNNHTPAAACVVFCLAATLTVLQEHGIPRTRPLFAMGFFAAGASCFELPAASLGVAVFVLAAWRDPRRTFANFVPAALIPLSAFFITNAIVTGGIRPFYTYYGTETYLYTHEGIPSYWLNPQDLDASSEPPLTYLFHCVLGHHGILSLTPVLLLTIPGWFLILRRTAVHLEGCERRGLRTIVLLGALLTLLTLAFYLSRTQNYNYGGNSVALRWLLWLSPFWWFAMVPVVESPATGNRRLIIPGVLLLASAVSVSASLRDPWQPSWLYALMERRGWIDYQTPPPDFDPPRRSVISRLPPDGAAARGVWSDGHGSTLTLVVLQTPEEGTTLAEPTRLRLTLEGRPAASDLNLLLDVDPARLAAGADISDWLNGVQEASSPEGQPEPASDEIRRYVTHLLRGMPAQRAYVSQGPIWHRPPSRPRNAWEFDRGAAQVVIRTTAGDRRTHRCEVLYCDELPFGVYEWAMTVRDESGTLLSKDTWRATTDPAETDALRPETRRR